MRLARVAPLLSVLVVFAVSNADAELIPSADGQTVYDTILQVRWLADANLAAKAAKTLGVANVDPNGSMSYQTALQWLAALNGQTGGAPYLGHSDWTLPTSPTAPSKDPTCSATGPDKNSFGYGCSNSALGSLFYLSLGLQHPNTAVPIPGAGAFVTQRSNSQLPDSRLSNAQLSRNVRFPFTNFQPYLYWSDTPSGAGGVNGYYTFSFNTGWRGSNVDKHYMYVLPMIPGMLPGVYHPTGFNHLQVSEDGQAVYDPDAVWDPATGAKGVTWLADADLAKTERFGVQCVNTDGTLCINPDGSMSHTTALAWISGMNAFDDGRGWLGQTHWQLPPSDPNEPCTASTGFGCTGSPMGELFYDQLRLRMGTSVVAVRDADVGPFHDVQPYLYWSCGAQGSDRTCEQPAAPGFEWSFSFGNGFQGTDVVGNHLYVMVYRPEAPAAALATAVSAAQGADPELDVFLLEAASPSSAANAREKAGLLGAFIDHVNAQRGEALTGAQANELIALAQAVKSTLGVTRR